MARVGGGIYKLPSGKVEGGPPASGVPTSNSGGGAMKGGGGAIPSNPAAAAAFGINRLRNMPNAAAIPSSAK
jgi:hypothetical protein